MQGPFDTGVIGLGVNAAALWALADRVFPGYAPYRRRAAAAGREIPLVQLVPR